MGLGEKSTWIAESVPFNTPTRIVKAVSKTRQTTEITGFRNSKCSKMSSSSSETHFTSQIHYHGDRSHINFNSASTEIGKRLSKNFQNILITDRDLLCQFMSRSFNICLVPSGVDRTMVQSRTIQEQWQQL